MHSEHTSFDLWSWVASPTTAGFRVHLEWTLCPMYNPSAHIYSRSISCLSWEGDLSLFSFHRSCSGSHDVSKWFSASNLCASWIRFAGIPIISRPVLWSSSYINSEQHWHFFFFFFFNHYVCLFLLDHWRKRSAAGSGFTSATRFPPRGTFPSPPSSSSTPCAPSCLHPTPCHDAPSSLVPRHGRLELPVHFPVPSSSYLLRAGWVRVFCCLFSMLNNQSPFENESFSIFPRSLTSFPIRPVSTDSHSQHGRPSFLHRDDRTSKTHERLQKKLKERQGGGGGGQMKDSPPPSPQKSCNSPPTVDIHNGIGGKGLDAEHRHAVACSEKPAGKGKNGESRGEKMCQILQLRQLIKENWILPCGYTS